MIGWFSTENSIEYAFESVIESIIDKDVHATTEKLWHVSECQDHVEKDHVWVIDEKDTNHDICHVAYEIHNKQRNHLFDKKNI